MGMSRRSRRGQSTGQTGWAVKIGIFLLVLAIGGSAVGYAMIRSYLHSDAFRVLLSERVSKALNVEGAFGLMRWDGLAARSEQFEGEGNEELLGIRADAIRTEIGIERFRDGYWLLKGTALKHLEVTYDARSRDDGRIVETDITAPTLPDVKPTRPWFPREIRYDTIEIGSLSANVLLDAGELKLANHRLLATAVDGTGGTDFHLHGGTVTLPFEGFPPLRLNDIKARHQNDAVFLTTANFGVYDHGVLDLVGEWGNASKQFAIQGGLRGVECADLLNEDWSRRLTGKVLVDFAAQNRQQDGLRVNGELEIHDGVLTALPLLDSLSAYADTQRFRVLTLQEARADWSWANGQWVFTNIRVTSEGALQLYGTLSIDSSGALDGSFRIGLAPGILSRIPGAETVVFQSGEFGLLWTTFRISGTLEKPREDLSSRLLAAAGMRMLEILPDSGERVLKNTRTLLGEIPDSAVERAAKLIGGDSEGSKGDLLREAGSLLNGVLRGRNRDAPPPSE